MLHIEESTKNINIFYFTPFRLAIHEKFTWRKKNKFSDNENEKRKSKPERQISAYCNMHQFFSISAFIHFIRWRKWKLCDTISLNNDDDDFLLLLTLQYILRAFLCFNSSLFGCKIFAETDKYAQSQSWKMPKVFFLQIKKIIWSKYTISMHPNICPCVFVVVSKTRHRVSATKIFFCLWMRA